METMELFSLDEIAGLSMTPADARERYSFARDASEWHSQPVCVCGHYAATHEQVPPHRGTLRSVTLGGQGLCDGYRFARMGAGGPAGLGSGLAS